MNINNYYNWLAKQGVVGGIFYKPVQQQEEQLDIYGDPLNFSDLVISEHRPIQTTSEVTSGYEPRYTRVFAQQPEQAEQTTSVVTSSVSEPTFVTVSTPVSELKTPVVSVTTPTETVVETAVETPTKITTKLTGKSGFEQLKKLYEKELEKRGIDKRYAKWLASKDALETGWGEKGHGAVHLNYGNITVGSNWTGKSYEGGDHNAKGQKIKQKFRAYDSINDYVEDSVNLLTKLSRYKDVFTGDIAGFADRLYRAGYGEDPEYANKVKRIYNSW